MSGTKVTKDPEAINNPIQEGAGTVLSDSLAAESVRSGGDFGSDEKSGISDQSSRGTTTNVTDTSGAKVLDAAPDAAHRKDDSSEDAALNAAQGQGKSAGAGPTYNTSTSGSTDSYSGATSGGSSSDSGNIDSSADAADGQGSSNIGIAPTSQSHIIDPRTQKPKGSSLGQAGEITGNEPNESFRADIGSRNDPGLAAEQKFAKQNADTAATAGFPAEAGAVNDKGGYEQLDRNTEA